MNKAALVLLLTSILSGCASAPETAVYRTEHYEIQLDTKEHKLAVRIGKAAERCHARLTRYFGVDPEEDDEPAFLSIGVYRGRAGFEARLPQLTPVQRGGLEASYSPDGALLYWASPGRGPMYLVHLLVHHFAAQYLPPETPGWIIEGLAYALSHTSEHAEVMVGWIKPKQAERRRGVVKRRPYKVGCPWERVRAFHTREAQRFAGYLLEAGLPSSDSRDHESSLVVAGALVRFGLETKAWRDVKPLATWRPGVEAFSAWAQVSSTGHRPRFAPLHDLASR